jgi:hypothetical protein
MDDDDRIPSVEEAKQRWKKRIADLRKGDKADRRLADSLAQCRDGYRCDLIECPKCERRKRKAQEQIPASVAKNLSGRFRIWLARVKAIQVLGKRRPLNDAKVRAIAASMELIGLETPISVRKERQEVILVSGWHRLEAAKLLKWREIPCVVMRSDETNARIWQKVENFYRAELTVLERAEIVDELREVAWLKVVQDAPPGGQQPKDKGINKTAKLLGLTKEKVRRSTAIAAISHKAKVRRLGLDDNQRALLEIAGQPTPKAQSRVITEIIERKRAARDRNVSAPAADKKTIAAINALDTDIQQKEGALDTLKGELATSRKRRRELDDKLAVQGKFACGEPSSEAASGNVPARTQDGRVPARTEDGCPEVVDDDVAVEAMVPAAETELLKAELAMATRRVSYLEGELENARALASRAPGVDTSVPIFEDIPPCLDRRRLSAEDQLASDAVMAEFAKCTALQAALAGASPVVRERFITALRAYLAGSSSAAG